jgi:hypothetical protein
MANKFTRFLKGVGEGLLTPKGVMADWRHASRLFIDNQYRLSPRTKFNFYVRFEIAKSVLSSGTFLNKHADEVGYLIKSTDLPKYKFETVTKNQYNRKKIIYKNFSYDPISLTFRDDNAGVMNAMWALYMGSYIQDRNNPEAAYSKTNYRATGAENLDAFRYGLDKPNKSEDFIKSVSIYMMSRKRFIGYTLVNPKITSWNHGGGDYTSNEINENQMNIEYEAVLYSAGNVSPNNPKGFATLYYDSVPSPLTVQGGGVGNLFGEGGVLDGLEQIFGDVAGGTAFSSPGNFLSTAISAINTARNISNLSSESIKREAINIINNPATIRGVVNTVSGLGSISIPKNDGGTTNPTATQVRIVPPVNDNVG